MHIAESLQIGAHKMSQSRLVVGLTDSDTKQTKILIGVHIKFKHFICILIILST